MGIKVGDALWVLFLFLLDRVTKYVALSALVPGKSVVIASLFGGLSFQLTLTMNKGAAWGFFSEFPFLLMCIRFLFIAALLFLYLHVSLSSLSRISLLCVLAGALGNIVDSLFWGHVVDMIHVTFWGWDYPVFNVADTLIFLGCLGFLWDSFQKRV